MNGQEARGGLVFGGGRELEPGDGFHAVSAGAEELRGEAGVFLFELFHTGPVAAVVISGCCKVVGGQAAMNP